jgi:transposase-like protein
MKPMEMRGTARKPAQNRRSVEGPVEDRAVVEIERVQDRPLQQPHLPSPQSADHDCLRLEAQMAACGQRGPEREQFWRRTIEACARSGDTIRGFCAERGLSEPSFYAWRRDLRRRDSQRREGGIETKLAPASARLVPIIVRPPADISAIEIERGGTIVRVPRDVDAAARAGILKAVGRQPC